MAELRANDQQHIAVRFERQVCHMLDVPDEANSADRRRWRDRLTVGLVIERDIAGDDWE